MDIESKLHFKPWSTYTSVSYQLILARLAQIKRNHYANPDQQVLANLELANEELDALCQSLPAVLRADYVPDAASLSANPQNVSEETSLAYTQNFQRYLVQITIDFERLTVNRIMSIYMPQTEWNQRCRTACLESAKRILAAAAAPPSPLVPFEFKSILL